MSDLTQGLCADVVSCCAWGTEMALETAWGRAVTIIWIEACSSLPPPQYSLMDRWNVAWANYYLPSTAWILNYQCGQEKYLQIITAAPASWQPPNIRLGKKKNFLKSKTFEVQIWRKKTHKITTNLNLHRNSVNQVFNPNALFFCFLRGAAWYYNAIYILFTYFASFIGYEDDILEVISNLQLQGAIFGGKRTNLAENLYPIFNTLSKITISIFSSCKRPTSICLQLYLHNHYLKPWLQGNTYHFMSCKENCWCSFALCIWYRVPSVPLITIHFHATLSK